MAGLQPMAMAILLVLGSVFWLDDLLFKTIDTYLPSSSINYPQAQIGPNWNKHPLQFHPKTMLGIQRIGKFVTAFINRFSTMVQHWTTIVESTPNHASPRRITTRRKRRARLAHSMFGFHCMNQAVAMTIDRMHAYAREPLFVDVL